MSIRERLGPELASNGVDCFVLLSPDRWNLARYMPHEVDSHLYYPEACYHIPSSSHIGKLVEQTRPHAESIRAQFDTDVTKNPVYWQHPIAQAFPACAVLFGDFNARERIVSSAMFARVNRLTPNPDLLLLGFRAHEPGIGVAFTSPQRIALSNLAQRIFLEMDRDIERRENDAAGKSAMLRTLQQITELERFVARELLSAPGRKPTRSFYERLLQLALPKELFPTAMVSAGLYRLSTASGGMHLRTEALVGEGNSTEFVERQECAAQSASITTCTALTGRTHHLDFVDAPGEASIPLPSSVASGLEASALPTSTRVQHFPGGMSRLFVSRAPGSGSASAINALRPMFGHVHAGLLDRLAQNCERSYSELYKDLTGTGQRAGSELCIPIFMSHQPVGCINIEHRQPYQLNPFAVTLLMAVRDAMSVAVGRDIDVDVLSSIHRTSEHILRNAKALLNTDTLDEFAERIRLHTLTDEVIFCTRRRAAAKARGKQAIYDVVAASKQVVTRSRAVVRHSGWTAYLWDHPDPHVQGVLLGTLDGMGIPTITGAWNIAADASGEATGEVTFEEVPHRRQWPELNGAAREARIRMQIGVRIADAATGNTKTVIWFSYVHPGRAYPSMGSGTRVALEGCVRNLISVARWCSIVPDMVRSRALMYGRFFNAMSHEGLGAIVEGASLDLRLATKLVLRAVPVNELGAAHQTGETVALHSQDVAGIQAHVGTAELAVEYLIAKIDALTHYSAFEEDDRLAQLVEKRAGRVDLGDVIREAWLLARKSYPRKHLPKLEVSLGPAKDQPVHASRRHLLVLLVNILQNSLKHGKPKPGSDSVIQVDVGMVGDRMRVVVADNGPGFPSEFLAADVQEILDRGVPGSYERQGAMLIKRLSRASSGEPAEFANIDGRGAGVVFVLPLFKGVQASTN